MMLLNYSTFTQLRCTGHFYILIMVGSLSVNFWILSKRHGWCESYLWEASSVPDPGVREARESRYQEHGSRLDGQKNDPNWRVAPEGTILRQVVRHNSIAEAQGYKQCN